MRLLHQKLAKLYKNIPAPSIFLIFCFLVILFLVLEAWLSGLKQQPAKLLTLKGVRRFESFRLRGAENKMTPSWGYFIFSLLQSRMRIRRPQVIFSAEKNTEGRAAKNFLQEIYL